MFDFVRFSSSSTPIKLEGVCGLLNGYKINDFTHGGRLVNLRNQNYYYIPSMRQVVTYKATSARLLTISAKRKFSFRETNEQGYGKNIQVDAQEFFLSAANRFN